MRRAEFEISDPALIEAFLTQAQSLTLATVGPDGAPYATSVNFIYRQDRFYLHSAPRGRKMENLRAQPKVFLNCAEEFAFIPSYATDPEAACAATHFFRSVHVRGLALEVEDLGLKARVLGALMAKMQPEGGHLPLDQPQFEAALRGTALVEVEPLELSAKFKFGQHLSAPKRAQVLAALERSEDRRAANTAEWVRALGAP